MIPERDLRQQRRLHAVYDCFSAHLTCPIPPKLWTDKVRAWRQALRLQAAREADLARCVIEHVILCDSANSRLGNDPNSDADCSVVALSVEEGISKA